MKKQLSRILCALLVICMCISPLCAYAEEALESEEFAGITSEELIGSEAGIPEAATYLDYSEGQPELNPENAAIDYTEQPDYSEPEACWDDSTIPVEESEELPEFIPDAEPSYEGNDETQDQKGTETAAPASGENETQEISEQEDAEASSDTVPNPSGEGINSAEDTDSAEGTNSEDAITSAEDPTSADDPALEEETEDDALLELAARDDYLATLIADLPEISDPTGTQYYYYNQLNDLEKVIYWKIYNATYQNNEFTISGVGDYSDDELLYYGQHAMSACISDHPLIHTYLERGLGVGSYRVSDDIFSLYLDRNSAYSDYRYNKSISRANDIVGYVGMSGDQYTRLRRLLTLMAYEMDYDLGNGWNFASQEVKIINDCLLSCFVNGSSVCAGFSDALKYLCDMLNIPCIVVGNAGHAWNFVRMENGQWYSVDASAIVNATDFDDYETQISYIAQELLLGSLSDPYLSNSNYHISDLYISTEGVFAFPVLSSTQYVYSGTYVETYKPIDISYTEPELTFLYEVNADNKTCTIKGCEGSMSGNLVIPGSIDGYTVTAIADSAFYRCSGFTGTLSIPDSVVKIGVLAFFGCDHLSGNLDLPAGLEYLGSGAFACCSSLSGSVYLPDSLTYCGVSVFYQCDKLNGEIRIPDAVDFSADIIQRSNISSIRINDSNEKYTSYDGIVYSKDMTVLICCPPGKTGTVDIPNGVKEISEYACFNCSKLTGALVLPDSVLRVGNLAFYGCSGLSGDLILPDSIETIGSLAFGIHASDTGYGGRLKLPANVKKIENDAFSGCGFTGEVFIPDSLTELGDFVFNYNVFSAFSCSCSNEFFVTYYKNMQMESMPGLVTVHPDLTYFPAKEATKTAEGNKEYYQCNHCHKLFSDAAGRTEITAADTVIPKLPDVTVGATASVSTYNLASGIQVDWEPVDNATGYFIYRKAGSGSYTYLTALSGHANTSYTDTTATSNGKVYIYLVYAYATVNGTNVYTKDYNYSFTYRLTKPTISSVTNSASRKMTVKWNKNAKAAGYVIQYSQKSSFASSKYVVASKATTVSKVISSLTKGKTYYVRICSYKVYGGITHYSDWSNTARVKISK